MKTPKEKAEELIQKYKIMLPFNKLPRHKQCALIACDEIIANTETIQKQCMAGLSYKNNIIYWQEVKNELQKM